MQNKRKKKVAYRKNVQNRFSKILITIALGMIILVSAVGGSRIKEKLEVKRAEYEQNEKLIEKEHEREKEIELLGKRSQTKEYYEELAKEKLGLVHPDEILFKKQ